MLKFIVSCFLFVTLAHAEEIKTTIPEGWALASEQMGESVLAPGALMKQEFTRIYIPQGNRLPGWTDGQLTISRFPYSNGVSRETLVEGIGIAEDVINRINAKTEENCPGDFRKMAVRSMTTKKGYRFSISGGICAKPNSVAPYGEGSIFAFIEGDDYLHQISFNWRPNPYLHPSENKGVWGIEIPKINEYLNRIKTTDLCGVNNQDDC